MKYEISAGAVVFFIDAEENILYLILHYSAGHWDLPKGHIEEEENAQQAAVREIKEEAGLEVTLLEGFEQSYEYFFKNQENELIHKKAIFFITRTFSHTITLSHEHQDHRWANFNEAIKIVTFANTRQLLQLADQWIRHNVLKRDDAQSVKAF